MSMSKMVSAVSNTTSKQNIAKKEINFMGGVSYRINPLDTLKMIAASSIFGEPAYYRDGEFSKKTMNVKNRRVNELFQKFSIFDFSEKTTADIMEKAIDEALSYDFGATLELAATLRSTYMMRLNPQVIMVRAAIHPGRKNWTENNPGKFGEINQRVMARADEPAAQLTYYLYKNGKKNNLPSLLKRSWATKLENLKPYAFKKYCKAGLGMRDTIKICHANSPLIDEFLTTGTINVGEEDKTWETLRSQGKSWKDIRSIIRLPHMALLRNLRGIAEEKPSFETMKLICDELKMGVPYGKQFPFRYWSAYKAIEETTIPHKILILDTLEECMDISCDNMPKLKGRTACLSDNSGSAWGAFTSEYGSVTIAEIDNLSSIITARNSEEGYVIKFGDTFKVFPISKKVPILHQLKEMGDGYDDIGGRTENGIWEFLSKSTKSGDRWDNIFIYSDQQAGHGGLYGINPSNYREFSYHDLYIDVMKMINDYRHKINSYVNVFSVQTAGYTNSVLPEYGYRTSILTGWTGKELVFASSIIGTWDEIDDRNLTLKTQGGSNKQNIMINSKFDW